MAEIHNDFIFAVAGEELGFIGCCAIILILSLIVVQCIRIGRRAKDMAGMLIACGVGTLVAFQSFLNISVATGLLPNTGTTLPFVSYGLTSLWTFFMGMGLVLNVGLQNRNFLTRNEELLKKKMSMNTGCIVCEEENTLREGSVSGKTQNRGAMEQREIKR